MQADNAETFSGEYICGVDLGQSNDYTAVVILQLASRMAPRGGNRYRVVHIDRIRDQSYVVVGEWLTRMLQTDTLRGHCRLVVDHTGVGSPVVDHLRIQFPNLTAVNITPGVRVTGGFTNPGVPKRDLIASLEVAFEQKRLQIIRQLELADALLRECQLFERHLTAAGHDTYSAPVGEHDDLLLACALACWLAEFRGAWIHAVDVAMRKGMPLDLGQGQGHHPELKAPRVAGDYWPAGAFEKTVDWRAQ